MGKRLSIELVELLGNPEIEIKLDTDAVDPGERAYSTATVHFKTVAMDNPPAGLDPVGPLSVYFDVDAHDGKITLGADFNLWGSQWWPLMAHLHNNSITYRVA